MYTCLDNILPIKDIFLDTISYHYWFLTVQSCGQEVIELVGFETSMPPCLLQFRLSLRHKLIFHWMVIHPRGLLRSSLKLGVPTDCLC